MVCFLPRPSLEQVDNFVKFVSGAHSWYKHLPLLPPGMPFFFFLDPFSGYDKRFSRDGSVVHVERTENSERLHYSWMFTRTYRERFGHLDYAMNDGTKVLLRTSTATHEYADPPKFWTVEGLCHLPPEVTALGSVELTGVIDPRAQRDIVWTRILPIYIARHPADPPRQWPEETGGDSTLRKILEVCEREMHCPGELDSEASIAHAIEFEAELRALLQPEKERLQAKMTQAINRMLDLLYSPPTV